MISTILKQASQFVLSRKLPDYRRFLLSRHDFSDRLIGVRGARGSGKTTLLLQHAQASGLPVSRMLYIACDHPAMVGESLYDIAQQFYQSGGKLLLIDEIHKAKDFAQSLKAIYDTFDLQVVFFRVHRLYKSRNKRQIYHEERCYFICRCSPFVNI